MNPYIRLFRPEMVLIRIAFLFISSMIVPGSNPLNAHMIIGAVSVALFVMGGNALNDYADSASDSVSHPSRPVPSGQIPRENTLYAGCSLLIASAIVAALLPVVSFIIVATACALETAYELRLKRMGLAGNLTIGAVTGMTFLLGGSIAGDVARCAIPSLAVMLISVSREISSDIADAAGDIGRRTLPRSIGLRGSRIIASLVLLSAVPVSLAFPVIYDTGTLFFFAVVPYILIIETSRRILLGKNGTEPLMLISMLLLGLSFGLGSF